MSFISTFKKRCSLHYEIYYKKLLELVSYIIIVLLQAVNLKSSEILDHSSIQASKVQYFYIFVDIFMHVYILKLVFILLFNFKSICLACL